MEFKIFTLSGVGLGQTVISLPYIKSSKANVDIWMGWVMICKFSVGWVEGTKWRIGL
jgi:hypothetical protein